MTTYKLNEEKFNYRDQEAELLRELAEKGILEEVKEEYIVWLPVPHEGHWPEFFESLGEAQSFAKTEHAKEGLTVYITKLVKTLET